MLGLGFGRFEDVGLGFGEVGGYACEGAGASFL